MTDTLNLLIVEKPNELKDLLTFFFEAEYHHQPKVVHSITDAVDELKHGNYNLVVVDYEIEENKKSNIREFMHQRELKIPYFLLSNLSKSAMPEYENKTIEGLVQKDTLFESLKFCMDSFFVKEVDPSNQVEYYKITMRCLSHIDSIDEDCFIQLKSGRYLKLFSKGDQITSDDINRYREKGVDKLFVKKEVAHWVMKKFADKMPEIVKHLHQIHVIEKTAEMENGPDSSQEMNILNIEKNIQEIIEDKVKKTIDGLKKKPSLAKMLKELNLKRSGDHYMANHIDLLCNISVGLAKSMDWCTDATMEKLVFVALSHDILLVDKPGMAKLQNLDDIKNHIPKLSDKEVSFVLGHPLKTADMIRSLANKSENIPPGVDLMIEQHHERPDGTGFPKKIQANRITPLSSLFIVSHDLANYIIDNPAWTLKKYMERAKKEFHGSNFTKVIFALSKLSL